MEPDSSPPPSLDDLLEAPLPEPVSLAPATTAWTVAFVVFALLALLAAYLVWRRWRRNRYRREGLVALDEIDAANDLAQVPVLVKRVALEAWPRSDVAGLTGEAWLQFLDASFAGSGFADGPGRVLPDLAYASDVEPAGPERAALLTLVRTWIRTHRRAS